MEGTCLLHSRPATTTCARCGVFLCDWCEKLAPSWATRTCGNCLKHLRPAQVGVRGVTMGSAFLVALLGSMALFRGFALMRDRTMEDLALFVGFLAATGVVLFSLRKK